VSSSLVRGRGRFALAVSGVLSICVLLSACGSSSSSSGGASNAAASAPVSASGPASGSITVAAPATGGSNLPALFLEAKAFEKANPNIKIKTLSYPNNTFYSVVQTQLQGGGGPDVWIANAGTGDQGSIIKYGKAGLAANLAGRPWASEVPSAARSQYYVGNALYGVPMDYVPYGWIYNPTLYKKWGVSIPQNMSQALAMCQAAKARGDVGIAIAGAFPANTGATAMMYAASDVYANQPNWDALRAAGKVTFANSPGWKQTLEDFMTVYKAGCFQQGAAGGTFDDLTRLLGGQKAGTNAAPTEAIPTAASFTHITLGAYPSYGSGSSKHLVYANFGNAVAMNAHSQNKAATLKFIDFLASQQGAQIYATADNNPTYQQAASGNIPSHLGITGIVPELKSSTTTIVWPPSTWPNFQVYNAFGMGVTGLMTGQTTIPAVLQSMDSAWSSSQ
jgi:raffinose/stachyose/melibiose transport system substrate-binding protein